MSESRRYCDPELEGPNVVELSNPVCGDEIRLQIEVSVDRIIGFGYQAKGCWPVYGCLEFLGARCMGRTVDEVLSYRLEDFLSDIEGVPASKRHAFSLTIRGVIQAVTKSWAQRAEFATSSVGRQDQERL